MRTLKSIALFGTVLSFSLMGCGAEEPATEGKPDELGEVEDKESLGKADAWNYRNNPNGLRVEMNYKLADFPLTGESENKAWPDTYWPTYEDSTNHRWQTTGDFLTDLSPMEKYDAAFNGWDPESVKGDDGTALRPFNASNCDPESWDNDYYSKLGPAASFVSHNKGNQRTRSAAIAGDLQNSCQAKTDNDCMKGCEDEEEGTARRFCENRCHRGGVETWWGLCHAWAPAAILEQEPLHPVTYNGVTFEVGDIKALYSVIYDRSDSALIGGRCNDNDVERDEDTGRVINDDCRDLNAGSFHVVMSNLLGLQKRGFVEDRTFDYQVWNQPVQKYEVTKMEAIDVTKAHDLLRVDGEEYTYNADAAELYEVEATLYWITESHASTIPEGAENHPRYTRNDRYHYIVEVDSNGNVIGGEWLDRSITAHPDFVWLPFRPYSGNRHVSIDEVRMLGRLAQTAPAATTGPTEDLISVQSEDTPLDIPDKDAVGITSAIVVGDAVEASKITVNVDIEHTYIGDLVLTVTSPRGQSWKVHNKEGGPTDNLKKTFKLKDISGTIDGEWTLHIKDVYARDIGSLRTWKINFQIGGDAEAEAARTVIFTNRNSREIPDNNARGVGSYINVDEAGAISGLEVSVDITHTYISDLTVVLKKGALEKTLHEREGGSDDDLVKSFTIDEFNGQEAEGRWFLFVKDTARLDIGTRKSWSLKITY